ncbi:MAG: TonB family protein [Limnohabitans sp.]
MTTAEHSAFTPPPAPGLGRSLALALVAHVLQFAALWLVTNWNTRPITFTAEAELWSAVPQAAAPATVDTPQNPPPGPGTPPPPPAPPPAPQPADTPKVSEADIALQKKREKELQQAKEKEKQLAREKARKEQAEKEQKEREAQEKKRQAEQRKKEEARQEAQEKAEAARAEALRQENLRRMQGLAGATGGENATGSAARSSGPSASYASRLVGRIRPNIVMTGEFAGNPRTEVEVRVAADGTILSSRIVKSSGVKAWDDAVLRAIEKTEIFPKDIDGRVPPVMVLGFRPTD